MRLQGPRYVHNSGAHLASLTDKELQEKLQGAMPGNGDWVGATAEIARRAGSRQEKWIVATFIVSVIAAIAGVAALFR